MTGAIELTHDEANTMIALVAGLDPDKYPEPSSTSVIYKARAILEKAPTKFTIRNTP